MALKPWREIAVPHEDVRKGIFQQAEYAADLSRVHQGTAAEGYQNPVRFFERTFITEGMRLLLDGVARRLCGQGGEPVIQLQTAFGGGKTHTMLSVYHMASGAVPASDLNGISEILDQAGVSDLPKARIVVLDGINLDASKPKIYDGLTVRTIWGELARQLGGSTAYERVKEADLHGTAPAKDVLSSLIADHSPCVILIDELVAYLRQFENGKSYAGGTFDSNLTFVQALTEAMKAVPNAVLLGALPESKMEVGSPRGQMALDALEKYFGRVQSLWKPVATEEAFEIVRRRLFVRIDDTQAQDSVCRAFSDYYIQNDGEFPHETLESRYFDRLKNAYPIHPEVFDRLYEDWSSLEKFQRTRGVLKLMAKVIHRLWKDNNTDYLIMPGSLPLYDHDTRNEAIYYLPQGWDPVLERDIDGEKAETTVNIDNDTRFGAVQAARRTARTIFLGSAPSTGTQVARGIEIGSIILGCAQPGQSVAVYKDALRRLTDRLHYLNTGNNRYWFDTRPNLRREMEERKRRFNEKDEVIPVIKQQLQGILGNGSFAKVHVFTPNGDVPDDYTLRLVVLPPDVPYAKADTSLSFGRAAEILKSRGEQPRQKQNRLIFMAADYDSNARLKDQTRTWLAWQSIVEDINDLKLNLDQLQARQAKDSMAESQKSLQRMVRETYRWLIVPMQEAKPGKGPSEIVWDAYALSSGSGNLMQELESKLKENELLISEWSPIHLSNLLKAWFWKDGVEEAIALDVWQKTCCYLYLPRLKDEEVFKRTVSVGSGSSDFFALAYGKGTEGYKGLSLGTSVTPIMDETLLLIEPESANAIIKTQAEIEKSALGSSEASQHAGKTMRDGEAVRQSSDTGAVAVAQPAQKTTFYAKTELDPIRAKLDFAQIVDEVIQKFTSRHDANVRIKLEIEADTTSAFDEKIQRDVKENCSVLKFKNAEFE